MSKVITLSPSGQNIPVLEGDTVLMSLERGGYALPNNCRAGACGECKVRVLEGQFDQGFVMDMALSQEERKQGFGLMCMAKPLSERLVIEWGSADASPKLFPPREGMPYVVVEKIQRTPRICEFQLLPLGAPLRFWPGQYVAITAPKPGATARHYSLANAPRQDGSLVLQVTRVEGGQTSNWLHEEVAIGDGLSLSGPYGSFIGDPKADTPVLCLAAGSGLAPLLSLTEAALKRGYRKPVTLLFSARREEDFYAKGRLLYWSRMHRNFSWKLTLTGEEKPGVLHGRLPGLLPKLFPDLSAHSVFVAGSTAFTEDCLSAVRALGAQESLLHHERFISQRIS